MSIPLSIGIYDKTFVQRGTFGAPLGVTVNQKWMDAGTAQVIVSSDAPRLDAILDEDGKASKGARLWIKDSAGQHVMSGRVTRVSTQGPATRALTTLEITDDFQIFKDALGWVIPTAAISAQGTAGTNWTQTGPAETVLLAAIAANIRDRLDLPVTVPVSVGRGKTITAQLRMNSIYDAFFPVDDGLGLVNDGGFGVGVRQKVGGLEVYTWTPKTVPQTLSEESGVISDWSYDIAAPTITRGVIGGAGDGTLRVWRERADTDLEEQIGWKMETWKDDSSVSDPTQLYNDLQGALDDGASKVGLSITFSQTENFKLGTQYTIGDVVKASLGGVSVTDRLTTATLTWTADGGYKAVPQIGDRTDDPDEANISLVARIARAIRRSNAGH